MTASQQRGAGSDRGAALDDRTLAIPIGLRLKLAVGAGGAGIAIVDERHTVPDEHFGFNRDALADECVTANLATAANLRSLLDFNERPDLCSIADFAAVEVDKGENLYVAAKLNVSRNPFAVGNADRSQAHRFRERKLPELSALKGRKRLVRARECHRGPVIIKRCGRGFENLHELESLPAPSQRLGASFNAIKEMLALQLQGLLLLDVRDVAVPVVIGVLELRERVVVRRPLHPHVVDANLLERLQVIIHDHPARADDGHFTNLSRLEPAALDGGKSLVAEGQRHVRHVRDVRCHVGISLAIHRDGKFLKNVQDD